MSTTSKAAPKTGHKHPASTREQRGIELYRSGAVSEHGNLYVVRGAGRNYTVSLVDGEPRCDCPDFQARRSACKHGYSVVIHAAKRRCRRAARPADRPSRRHGERTERPRDDRPDTARPSDTPRRDGSLRGVLDPARVRANLERMGG